MMSGTRIGSEAIVMRGRRNAAPIARKIDTNAIIMIRDHGTRRRNDIIIIIIIIIETDTIPIKTGRKI